MYDMVAFLNIVFFALVILCVLSAFYFLDTAVKLLRKSYKPERLKRMLILGAAAGLYAGLFIGLSTFWVTRAYGLPEVEYLGRAIVLEGEEFRDVSMDWDVRAMFPNINELNLTLVGRERMAIGITPVQWALMVIFSPLYYVQTDDWERNFIFYNDAGGWRIFQRWQP